MIAFQSNDAGRENEKGSRVPTRSIYETGKRITCIDRAIIRSYFHAYIGGGSVRCRKNEGYAERAAEQMDCDSDFLPAELECRLTPLPRGYCRMLRGSAVLLVEEGTHKVIDAVRSVQEQIRE